MTLGRHPTLDDRLGARVSKGDVFGDSPERVADVLGAADQGWQLRIREHVRHFLEPRHVLRLDLRHLIEPRIVGQRSQTLVPALSVYEIEDARFGGSGGP
jgi:hypothetical protein